jgi:hypothetical protein
MSGCIESHTLSWDAKPWDLDRNYPVLYSYEQGRPAALPRYHHNQTGYLVADLWELYKNEEYDKIEDLGYKPIQVPPDYYSNNSAYTWDRVRYIDIRDSEGKFEDEDMIKSLYEIECQWTKIRRDRLRLLQDSDWTQTPDLPEEMIKEWALYREKLRDMPDSHFNDDPWSIVFPEPPVRSQPGHYLKPKFYLEKQVPYK